MLKEQVLAKLEEYKDKPVEIGIGDEGIVLYGGFDGHWLFTKDDVLIEIKKNSNEGTYGVGSITQAELPFIVISTSYDMISYVKGYIPHKAGAIAEALKGLTVAGSSKSLDEIQKEMESDSILSVYSARGNLNTENVEPGTAYGMFMGSAISTEKGGLPKYMDSVLTK